MKIKFILLLLILTAVGYSQPSVSQLKEANHLYKVGDYKESIALYDSVLHQGYSGASLFYNLGNAYYRTGNFGMSILNYEKALQITPGDEDILHNLAVANSKIVDKVDIVPKFFLFTWWEAFESLLTPKGWKVELFIFYLLLLISSGLFFTAKKVMMKKYSFFSGIMFLSFFLLSLALYTTKQNQLSTVKYGVVLNQVVNVKSSPDAKSSDAFILHEGIKVKVEDNLEGWAKIRLTDGKIGWLESHTIGII